MICTAPARRPDAPCGAACGRSVAGGKFVRELSCCKPASGGRDGLCPIAPGTDSQPLFAVIPAGATIPAFRPTSASCGARPRARPAARSFARGLLLAGFLGASAHAAIGVNKNFSPISASVGQVSVLTIELLNAAATPATATSITDNLPSGMVIATPAGASTNCAGGVVTATPGGTSASLSGATIPAAGAGSGLCSFTVNVVSGTAGSYVNVIPVGAATSSQGSNTQSAQATLTVVALAPVAASKAFSPTNIHGGGTSVLTITLPNSNGVALTGVSFTDTLPAQLLVANPANLTTTCPAGTPTGTPGGTSVGLGGGTINANSSCTVRVSVTTATPASPFNANATNSVAAGNLTSTQGVSNLAFSNTIRVQTSASVTKAFAPATIFSGGTSTLTITVNNFNSTAMSPITFTDSLPVAPSALTIANPANLVTTCTGTVLGGTPGDTFVGLSGGSLAAAPAGIASTSCTLSVSVTATNLTASPVTKTNTIPAGNFGGNAYNAGSATLTVNPASAISGSKAFSGSLVQTGVMAMTVTLTNRTAAAATITSVTDNLTTMGAGFTIAPYPPAATPSTTCAGGSITATSGATQFTMAGGVIPANGSCTITVPIAVAATATVATHTNTIAVNGVVTSIGNNAVTITGATAISAALALTKSFSPATVYAGTNSRLTINVQRNANVVALDNIAFTDNLPAGHVIATPPSATTTCGGTVTAVAGGSSVSLGGGSLAGGTAATSCTVGVDVVTPGGSAGAATNTIAAGSVTTTQGVTNAVAATAVINRITNFVSLGKGFSPTTVGVGVASQLSLQILNNNPGAVALSGVGLSDSLPAGMFVATPPAASFTGSGCSGATLSAVAGASSFGITNASIAANSVCLISINVVPTVIGNLINNVPAGALTSSQFATNLSPVSATLTSTGQADLSVVKTDGVTQAVAGSGVTYTIVAANAGPFPVTGANFADSPPAGVTFVSWTCTPSSGASCAAASGSGPISALVSIPVGGNVTYSVIAAIDPAATGSIANTATITAPASVVDTNQSNNSATDTDSVSIVTDLSISKTDGSATYTPGTPISYTLVATNSGPSNAIGALLSDNLPAAISGTSWTATYAGGGSGPASGSGNPAAVIDLPVGATATLVLNGQVSAAASGNLANTGTIAPAPGASDPFMANNNATDTDTPAPVADLAISKTDGSATYTPGNAISYAITATNSGPGDVVGATVADALPGAISGASWSATYAGGASGPASGSGNLNAAVNIPVGGAASFVLGGTVSPGATGNLANTATITPPPGTSDPVGTNNSATDIDTPLASADISLVKTGPAASDLGAPLGYALVISNGGPSDADGTTFSDSVPAAITAVGASCGNATGGATCGTVSVVGNNVSGSIPALPASGSVTITITGNAPASGTSVTNNASANAPGGLTDPQPLNNNGSATTTLLQPQLGVSKSASPDPFVVGQPASYSVTVQNSGTGSTFGAITLADTLPPGVSLTGFAGSNWSCSGTTALACTFSATLAAGASTTLVLDVAVAASASSGNNSATASGGADGGCPGAARCSGSVAVGVVGAADIALAKSVDNALPNVGDSVTFTVTASNNGPSDATGVLVSDGLPAGLAFVSATASQGNYVSGSGLWSIGALANGASATLQISASVQATGSIVNTATRAGGDQLDLDGSNNSASAGINAQPSADLQLLKTASSATPNLGAPVTFTLTLTNAGPNDATGIAVSDLLPAGLNFISATPSQGSYADASGLWTVGALANAAQATLAITATVGLPGDITNTATITAADQHDPNTANNGSGVTINGQSADLQVIKTVDNATPTVGSTIHFTIIATNNGPSAASGVAINDVLPPQLAFVGAVASSGSYSSAGGTWTIGNLAAVGAGATATLDITATVSTDGTFSNTAAVGAADQTDPNPGNNTSTVVIIGIPSADLRLTKSGPATVIAGQSISYTLNLANDGPSDAQNVVLDDPTPTGLSFISASPPCAAGFPCNAGTLANGGNLSVTVTLAVPSSATGTIANIATVASATADPDLGNNVSSVDTDVVRQADLGVVKSGPASVNAGSAISYAILVSNAGPSDASGASVSDAVPAAISGVSASCGLPTGGAVCGLANVAGNLVSSTVAALPAGASLTLQIDGIAPADAALLGNAATITAPGSVTDPDPGNNVSTAVTRVDPLADLSIVKSGPATATSGSALGYTLLIRNAGPSAADGASFSDALPAALSAIGASCGAVTGGALCAPPVVAGNAVSGNVPTLPAGGSVSISISATAPFGSQTIVNSASIAAPAGVPDPNTGNNASSVSTVVGAAADIAVSKIADNPAPNVGQAVVFTITATNNGPDDADGVALTDNLPFGLGFISAAASQGSYDSSTGVWSVGNLASGTFATLQLRALVNQPGALVNTVAVSASGQPDPNTSNNNAGAALNAGASADIALAKTASDTTPNVGSQVTYTITATNYGPNDASGIEVTDNLPPGTAFVAALPSQGSYDGNSGVWQLGALANAASATLAITASVDQAGTIINVATITAADQFDPVAANNQGGVTINGEQADLAVSKTVDNAAPNVGQDVAFTISVYNNGPSDASNVALVDLLPAGLAYVSSNATQGSYASATGTWTVGNLGASGPGSTATLTVQATVTASGAQSNTASVGTSDQPDPNSANNTATVSLNGNPLADLAVTKSGPATVTPGNTVTYTIQVGNSGPSDAVNVVIGDATPTGLAFIGNSGACASAYPCTLANLPSGASATITSIYDVPANYAGPNPIINGVSATSDTPDPDTTNNQASLSTVVGPGVADLSIVKGGPATTGSSATVRYTLSIGNAGASPANGASYADSVPAAITITAASCAGETGGAACAGQPIVSGNIVSGSIGSLPAGGGAVVTIDGIAPAGPATLVNTATVSPPAGITDPDSSNNASSISTTVSTSQADLSITKSGPANAIAGGTLAYTLVIANAGPDAVTDALISDPTPAGLILLSADPPCTAGFPCAFGILAAGQSATIHASYRIQAGFTGTISNSASIGSATVADPDPANNAMSQTTIVGGGPPTAVTEVPIDARWMLALLALLIIVAGMHGAWRSR